MIKDEFEERIIISIKEEDERMQDMEITNEFTNEFTNEM